MRLRFALLLVLCGLLALHALHFFQPVDDAFISFRYAENLAAGRGPVFNPGERVEGYSNFLWVVILAACRLLGAGIPWSALFLGLVLSLASILVAARVSRGIHPSEKSAGLPAALFLAASPVVAMWAGGGMEVPLFSLLALLSSDFWMVERGGAKLPWRWPLAACLAAMARPDGILLFVIALGWGLFASPGGGDGRWRRTMADLGMFAIPAVPYFLWRWIYYGAFLPNTYYAKVNYDAAVLTHGLQYLSWFLLDCGGGVIALGALLAIRPRDERVSLLLWQGAGFTAYVLLLGGDGYAYSRFLVPVAVLLAPAAEFGYRRAWRGLSDRRIPALGRIPALPALLLLAAAAGGAAGSFAGADHQNYRMGVESENRRRAIGEWLRGAAQPGSLIALNPIGMIPYLSGLPTLDLLGLTDAHIARSGERVTNLVLFAHNRCDPRYVLGRRPAYLILGQATTLDVDPRLEDLTRPGPATFDAIAPAVVRDFPGFPGDERMWGLPEFRRLYTPAIARIGSSYFYYFVFDSRAGEIEARLAKGHASGEDHAAMARILARKGEAEQALEEAAEASKLDRSLGPVRREIEETIAAMKSAGESRDRVLEVLRRLEGDLTRGDGEAGERDLLAGLERDPDHPLLLYNLGTLYEGMARPNDALLAYLRALEARPDLADACNNLGSIYARRGDLKRAREYWERAVGIDPHSPARENLLKLQQRDASAPP
jgi:tetratricopeptide (TPR) repeat protein